MQMRRPIAIFRWQANLSDWLACLDQLARLQPIHASQKLVKYVPEADRAKK